MKGNYADGQRLSPAQPWESIWFELLPIAGSLETLLPQYRRFILDDLCPYPESRKPYLYYNTWNFQERQHDFHNRPYIESMNLARIMDEIKVAHRLGVDVFVLDAGWFARSGDWQVDPEFCMGSFRSTSVTGGILMPEAEEFGTVIELGKIVLGKPIAVTEINWEELFNMLEP